MEVPIGESPSSESFKDVHRQEFELQFQSEKIRSVLTVRRLRSFLR